MKNSELMPASAICFGLDRETDEKALAGFIQRFAQDRLLEALIPRLESEEIEELRDSISRLMARHLSEGQYHRLFLAD